MQPPGIEGEDLDRRCVLGDEIGQDHVFRAQAGSKCRRLEPARNVGEQFDCGGDFARAQRFW